MKLKLPLIFPILPAFFLLSIISHVFAIEDASKHPQQNNLKIWYQQPANIWTEALPVGNGRLGAMVFGGIRNERIQLNEDTMWAGPPVPEANDKLYPAISRTRDLIFAGKYKEADNTIQKNLPPRISPRSYQTLGDLKLEFELNGEISKYHRWLELNTAIAITSFECGGVKYTREVFSSLVDDVLVVHLIASEPGKLNFTASLDRPVDFTVETVSSDSIGMYGQVSHNGNHKGVKYYSLLRGKTNKGADCNTIDNKIVIEKAKEAILYLSAKTDYNLQAPYNPLKDNRKESCEKTLDKVMIVTRSYDNIKHDHIREHQRLFNRVTLELERTGFSFLPTDLRLLKTQEGAFDPDFSTLYFQYGRYLLICSSRPGCMPANLQGIWNQDLEAPWNADYHVNINIQMNYWPAEICNLSECHMPFFDFIEKAMEASKPSAQKVYNCRGSVLHHTTDPWLFSVPFGSIRWGYWPMAGGWCAQHFMEHYRYTQTKSFLLERAWPVLKDSSLFYLDFLVENPETGKLVAGPCGSPENGFRTSDGVEGSLDMGASMSQQIIWDTFTNTLEAAEILDIKTEFVDDVRMALANLALPEIGPDGRLLEWSQTF